MSNLLQGQRTIPRVHQRATLVIRAALLGKATEAVSTFSIYHWTTMRHA